MTIDMLKRQNLHTDVRARTRRAGQVLASTICGFREALCAAEPATDASRPLSRSYPCRTAPATVVAVYRAPMPRPDMHVMDMHSQLESSRAVAGVP